MSDPLRECSVHPGVPLAGTCERCGDFFCTSCNATHLCLGCGVRAEEPPATRGCALLVAVACAALSGLFVIGLNALIAAATGKLEPLNLWNIAMGGVYLAIAVGLWRRSPAGYNWSIGTQGLNAVICVTQLFGEPSRSALLVALLGTRLALAVLGFAATRLARSEFRLP